MSSLRQSDVHVGGRPRTEPATTSRQRARPGHATVTWAIRMVRRGALLLAVSAGAYMALEVASFKRTYPDGINADQFAIFSDNPASRMLQGVPHGIDSAGGFAAWDGGWLLEMVLGFWAVLVVTRLLRGEEETDRGELLLVGPIRPGRVTTLALLVVMSGALLIGAGLALGLAVSGSEATSSVLFGLGMTGFAATFVGVGAVTAQVVDVAPARGSAGGRCPGRDLRAPDGGQQHGRAGLGGLAHALRLDRPAAPLRDPSTTALLALLGAPVLLSVVAVGIRSRRDTHGALLTSSDSRAPRHARSAGSGRASPGGATCPSSSAGWPASRRTPSSSAPCSRR